MYARIFGVFLFRYSHVQIWDCPKWCYLTYSINQKMAERIECANIITFQAWSSRQTSGKLSYLKNQNIHYFGDIYWYSAVVFQNKCIHLLICNHIEALFHCPHNNLINICIYVYIQTLHLHGNDSIVSKISTYDHKEWLSKNVWKFTIITRTQNTDSTTR